MPRKPARRYADPIKLIFAQTPTEKIEVGVIYQWNNGDETEHFSRDFPLNARLIIEPIVALERVGGVANDG